MIPTKCSHRFGERSVSEPSVFKALSEAILTKYNDARSQVILPLSTDLMRKCFLSIRWGCNVGFCLDVWQSETIAFVCSPTQLNTFIRDDGFIDLGRKSSEGAPFQREIVTLPGLVLS